jgi:hypothetical protein
MFCLNFILAVFDIRYRGEVSLAPLTFTNNSVGGGKAKEVSPSLSSLLRAPSFFLFLSVVVVACAAEFLSENLPFKQGWVHFLGRAKKAHVEPQTIIIKGAS